MNSKEVGGDPEGEGEGEGEEDEEEEEEEGAEGKDNPSEQSPQTMYGTSCLPAHMATVACAFCTYRCNTHTPCGDIGDLKLHYFKLPYPVGELSIKLF